MVQSHCFQSNINMNKYLVTLILIFGFCFAMIVFKTEERKSISDFSSGYVSIKEDSVLYNTIRQYISEHSLRRESSYIEIRVDGNSRNRIFYLSYNGVNLLMKEIFPRHYTFVDGFFVFLYSDIDYLDINNNESVKFYIELFEKNGFRYKSDSMTNHNPSWRLIVCDEQSFLEKSIGSTPKYYNLPCGYYFQMGGVNMDSVILIKD
jgi:hypothetical protein